MTRALTTRLAKLEARRRMQDEDFSRLSTAALEALQETTMLEIIAHFGGTIETAPSPRMRRVRADPARAPSGTY